MGVAYKGGTGFLIVVQTPLDTVTVKIMVSDLSVFEYKVKVMILLRC